ncbi:hypothetical protein AMS68_002213 [Peltaster fructicola]|uniref:Spherulation-specific family 4 n=1 Tax=Peltaster fructicola TaxID=286661 RepID=A0A6H0XPT2_9PEZI|nr:hypothetical protein AMS68_002213 [Peltaster fructicola]
MMPGMPELSGIRERLNSFVEEMHSPSTRDMREPLAVAVPLYIYPGEGCWDALYNAMVKHPSVEFHVVINPANGPGGRVPDACYVKEVARLNSFDNCKLFGYVHVSWGARKAGLVTGDITTWAHWKDYSAADIHVEGIFVDEAPADLDKLEYMEDIYKHTKYVLGDNALVWTNPGVALDERFYEVADLVNSHENTHEGWKTCIHSRNVKSTAMIHTYDGDLTDMRRDIQVLRKAGYRSILITTSNCYVSFSNYLEQFVEAVESSNQ